jgi:hypothetical protein
LLFSENNKLRIDDFETLAFGLQCDSAILKDIIENFDLFELEGDFFYSKRLSKTLDDICQKSLKASENAKKRWNNATAMRSHYDPSTIKVNESKVKKSKVNKIEDRIHDFKKSVFSHNNFDKEDLDNFFLYWTEKNKSGTKFRAELERTFSIPLRIARWCNNGFNKDKNKMPDYFDEVLYKKMDMGSKKEYEKKLKQNGFSYSYNPNSGGKWIKKAGV